MWDFYVPLHPLSRQLRQKDGKSTTKAAGYRLLLTGDEQHPEITLLIPLHEPRG